MADIAHVVLRNESGGVKKAMRANIKAVTSSKSVSIGFTILAFLMIMLMVRPIAMSLLSYNRTSALLEERRAQVDVLQERNRKLKDRYDYYQTDAFIVERGREYGLVMPGETPYVVRELARPEAIGQFARTRLVNATKGYGSNSNELPAPSSRR